MDEFDIPSTTVNGSFKRIRDTNARLAIQRNILPQWGWSDQRTLTPGGTRHLIGEHVQRLIPTLDQVSQEYVLVQAWKKAASYIRYHNWFSDTLELDRAAADLPRFISRLSTRLRSGAYETEELKLVPAPKSQRWHIDAEGLWKPGLLPVWWTPR